MTVRALRPWREWTRYYADGGSVVITPTSSDEQPDIGTFEFLRSHADRGAFTVDGWRVEVIRNDEGYAVAAVSLAEVDQTEKRLLAISGVVSLLVLGGIGLAAATVARVGLRPLHRMEAAAAEIAGGDLTRRVEDADPHTELGRLGTALNTMLVQIETAMAERTGSEQRLRGFLADAAARAAHPAHLDPGLRRAVPPGRRSAGA